MATSVQILPSTLEELNMIQSLKTPTLLSSPKKPGFEDIPVEKRYKREVSLPNGVENWNINNFDSYLHFDDHVIGQDFDVLVSSDDRLVPESEQRDRCASISSISSFVEEKQPMFHNFGVKTFSTLCVDSGSTCISSDHSYISSSSLLQKPLMDPEETYQNLDMFLQEVPEIKVTELLPSFSPISSTSSTESNFELRLLENYKTVTNHNEDSLSSTISRASKRPMDSVSEDEVFVIKHTKQEEFSLNEDGTIKYHEIRRKNNIASKNCRKTRKEKQKDMEIKVTELEQEKESLKVQVQVLEELIQAHKQCLLKAIANKR